MDFKSLNEQLEKFVEENKTIDFYTENLEQPITCEVDLDKYGNGSGKYITGFDLGDTMAVRMLGTYNHNVYNFKILEITDEYIKLLHPKYKEETETSIYKVGLNVEVSSGKELRFFPLDPESRKYWFGFLDLDRKMYNELVKI